MSHSRKKTPKLGFSSSSSEKEDKQLANRVFRRKGKQAVKAGKEPIENMNAVITTWEMAKDGKRYVQKISPKQMRK